MHAIHDRQASIEVNVPLLRMDVSHPNVAISLVVAAVIVVAAAVVQMQQCRADDANRRMHDSISFPSRGRNASHRFGVEVHRVAAVVAVANEATTKLRPWTQRRRLQARDDAHTLTSIAILVHRLRTTARVATSIVVVVAVFVSVVDVVVMPI